MEKEPSHSSIAYEKSDQVGFITLNRPDKFNSFNREMALELQSVLDQCEEDPEVRAIYITGAGKAFCAGQDISELTAEDGPEIDDILSQHFNPIISRLRTIEKPIVCAVNGVAAGAGANIALACDITLATASASFIQAFSKIGLIPDSGGTFFLPRILGMQKATALMMLGDKVDAPEAEKLGMIYKSVPDSKFEKTAKEIAYQLAGMPTKGLGLTKRALNRSLHNDLEHQLAIEEQLQSAAGQTDDYQEGIQAFLEKRKPNFKGS
ncbi:MAG: enoyl-CoA hydratase-related protein [Saprospiraceae bacterium]|nr:enoyl-CoA hydratase-related protein [Saprospiraceae bacterium]